MLESKDNLNFQSTGDRFAIADNTLLLNQLECFY